MSLWPAQEIGQIKAQHSTLLYSTRIQQNPARVVNLPTRWQGQLR